MYLIKYCQLTSRRIWSFGKLAGTQAMCEKLGGESVSFGKIENANWGRRSLLQLSPPKSGLTDVLPHFKENAHFVRKLQRKTLSDAFSRETQNIEVLNGQFFLTEGCFEKRLHRFGNTNLELNLPKIVAG